MLLAPVNEPIRVSWGKLQATQSVRLQVGLCTDDAVVRALFAQRNAKGRHYGSQRYQPSQLSRSASKISEQNADSFQSAFNSAKHSWFRAGQTALSVQQDISTFVEVHEAWVKSEIGASRAYIEATKWFVGAYAALFASWSVVSMRMVPIAGVGPRQFAIIAEEDLQPQTVIHELIGLLSSDPADNASHSNLSVLQDLDGIPRVLFGPLRLLNHCCVPNARFDFKQHGNGLTVTVRTNKIIPKGEEITISYGRGFWTEDTPCLCVVCQGPQHVARPDEDLKQEKKNKEARRNERRRKNRAIAKLKYPFEEGGKKDRTDKSVRRKTRVPGRTPRSPRTSYVPRALYTPADATPLAKTKRPTPQQIESKRSEKSPDGRNARRECRGEEGMPGKGREAGERNKVWEGKKGAGKTRGKATTEGATRWHEESESEGWGGRRKGGTWRSRGTYRKEGFPALPRFVGRAVSQSEGLNMVRVEVEASATALPACASERVGDGRCEARNVLPRTTSLVFRGICQRGRGAFPQSVNRPARPPLDRNSAKYAQPTKYDLDPFWVLCFSVLDVYIRRWRAPSTSPRSSLLKSSNRGDVKRQSRAYSVTGA
ncbi:hypothetical protein B0H12DRAFT_1217267 [Mycena haematopus]|nr:hypothetical protein B0H12DRAFT_1217267 [Mycena haematopus]